jgi:N utilization substance protein A
MAIISLGGRAEAIMPKEEQLPGEVYRPGAVVRAYVLKCEKKGSRLRIVLSRTHANFVRELFRAEIPEIADGLIEVKGIVREPGRRTKIAVASTDPRIDPVGSCVGMRGSRISKVTDELGGEKIDIIPWAEDSAQYIENSLKPARILRISYDHFRDRARVVVSQDQLPLAIGKAGQNVRLSARLTRYKIDVMSEDAQTEKRQKGSEELQLLIAAGLLDVTEPTVVPWEGLPEAHQSMWENRHSGATYIVNHALPATGLRSRDALLEYWAANETSGDA